MSQPTDRIAIVSVAGRFPGAGADLERFWANVSTAADCSRAVPPGRWHLPPDRCTDPRIANPDTVYSTRGYYLDPFAPELDGVALDAGLVAELDPLFHLALDVGNRAWREAKTEKVDRSRVGVVLGNICLPTQKSSDLCREVFGGTDFRRAGGVNPPVTNTHPWNRYVAGLPAGLLARGLGLGGGSFTLDAACASSLYALKLAADELLAGRADAMLAGGCSRPDCQYTQMGFAQLRALSVSGRCSPFDAAADGLMVGEGAGIFVLKRLTDALRHGDTIRGVIAGIGLSNDMHGNLLAPAKEGQLRAMRKAYDRAGWKPTDVQLIECHATGTPVGDAVEFESLRELWGETGWKTGQCAIGSVKSTVGHLLTGAGAAALTKVLCAFRAETLPPQANFAQAATGLAYDGGPFRVLATAEPWHRLSVTEPRHAAVSGFGFGGVNAHLLLEEWTGLPPKTAARSGERPKLVAAPKSNPEIAPEAPKPAEPVAVVGIAAHFGSWDDLRKFQEHVLAAEPVAPAPKVNGWGLAAEPCPPGFGIEELPFPIERFRIPPKELEETLPQQLLMLKVAAAALDDCRASTTGDSPTTGAFIGLGLDPNTMNFHLRWASLASGGCETTVLHDTPPPLTANRTMGALGSIAASRIARAFHFGGPSHTVCSEEGSAARALELGVRALQTGELDRVLVGGVDLACDPRTVLPGEVRFPGEGAAAFVLKRLADAERDGDRVYAVIRGVGVAADEPTALSRAVSDVGEAFDGAVKFDATCDVGKTGAASAAASLAKACVALWQEVLPGEPPRFWLHDRATGPRRATVTATGADGSHFAILLEAHAQNAAAPERAQPLGARAEAVFVIEGDSPAELRAGMERLRQLAGENGSRAAESLARMWFRESPPAPTRKLAVSCVARSTAELVEQLTLAAENLRANPEAPFPATAKPAFRDRVFFAPSPLGPRAKVAFVFPGSGNQFDSMGRDLAAHWPEVLRQQHAENELLRSQFTPEHFWDGSADAAPARDLMFGQVTVGALVSDIVASLGVKCDAMIGVSLGESAGLFGVRAWRDRDEMFRRMQRSTLFASDLAPPYTAARLHWGTPTPEQIDWAIGVVAASADDVIAAQRPGLRAFLLIVNAPGECVIGGLRGDVEKLAAAVGKPVTPLTGVTLAHCEAGRPVEVPYRELHTLPVTPPKSVTVYSGAWGKSYKATEKLCAESITAGLVGPIDVPAVIEAAYRDAVRAFVEVGPGNSCTRLIDTILGDRPHLARAAHAARQDAVSQMLRLVAHLAAERLPVNFAALYGGESPCVGHREPQPPTGRELVIPVGMVPRLSTVCPQVDVVARAGSVSNGHVNPSLTLPDRQSPGAAASGSSGTEPALILLPVPVQIDTPVSPAFAGAITPAIEATANVQVLTMQAQEAFLRMSQRFTESAAGLIRFQAQLLSAAGGRAGHVPSPTTLPTGGFTPPARPEVPRSLTFAQCCTFAAGRVADALGPRFAEIDTFPTRVRLPDGPLQLVDRITLIEGEPLSMSRGRVVTEHTVRAHRWYLEAGRIPTAIAVESGQADLFLSGFLGIDLQTRGLAVYRLLDAVVSFHRGLPTIGETVVYDIHIDEFVKQGDAWIFRFRFDGTVNGQPFITMRNGVAGFFTAEALAAGKGIVQTTLDRKPMPGKRPADWRELVPQRPCSLSPAQVESLRAGDLAAAFGPEFSRLPLRKPATLPGGMLRLVDRVPLIDPTGGRYGLGFVRAEFDIHPDDWFLTCHFVDDMVMPGTLMYECCLHTLRVLLMRMGWVGEAGEVVCEPVAGVNSRLKCRGQVIASTRTVTYEVTVKELGYSSNSECGVRNAESKNDFAIPHSEFRVPNSGEPYCLADALMYADGKPIVEITNMSLRMSGLTREKLEPTWLSLSRDAESSERSAPFLPALRSEDSASRLRLSGRVLYDSASILAFSNGKPSEAFGEPYRVFDRDRVIARLPGPPFQFLDCIPAVRGEPFVMKGGATCVAHYDVPPDAWYFEANRCENMPFAVLLEIALQPCGWLAAYCGSALTSPEDLSFRNLGGKATQFRKVTPETGQLRTLVKLTSVSSSAGMIIQHYDMQVRDRVGDVYTGTTYFGFFSKSALANQVGIRDASVPQPSAAERERAETGILPHDAPFPDPMLRMVDRIEAFVPDGGKHGLGLVLGKIAVDPAFWFFRAHFYQDPVWPGSLGLESFLQLLKYAAWKRWGERNPTPPNPPAPFPGKEGGVDGRAFPAPPSFPGKGAGGLGSDLAPPSFSGKGAGGLGSPHSWVYRGQVLPTDREVTVTLEVTAIDDENRRMTANGFLSVDGRVIYQMTDFTLE